jgi:hypothetical protein
MSEVQSTFVVSPITASFVVENNPINITPEAIGLTIFTAAGLGTPNSLSANIGNVHIFDGTNGQYLQTDGAGNLSWVTGGGSGNGVVGGSNTQVQFNDSGSFGGNSAFTFNKTTGNLTVPNVNSTTANIGNVTIDANGINTPGYYGDIIGGNLFSAYTMNALLAVNTANLTANIITANFITSSSNINLVGTLNITGNINSTTGNLELVDNTNITGNANISGNVNMGAKFGYANGTGGTVIQTPTRSSNVTLNKLTGTIQLANGNISSSGTNIFYLNNSQIDPTDMVIMTPLSDERYYPVAFPTTGQAQIIIKNIDSTAINNAQPVFKFLVLKAPVS